MPDVKQDAGKLRYDLIPAWFEEALARVLTDGAARYGDNSWKQLDNAENRFYAALRRHLAAFRQGEIRDGESGSHHMAHVAINAMFLMHMAEKRKE